MRLITRYILRQLVIGTLLVAAGLALVLWLTQSLRLVEMIIGKGLGVATFIHMTALLMPRFLVVVLPIALFAVILFTYNRLNGDRELVVMRAVGIGPFSLARPALMLAGALTLLCFALTLWVNPASEQAFREMRWKVRNDLTSVLIQEGAFTEIDEGLTVYVREAGPDDALIGVLIHDERDAAETVTVMAERGALVQGDDGPRILLENGNRQAVMAGTGRMTLLYFDRHVMEFDQTGGETGPRYRDASERSLSELLTQTSAGTGLPASEISKFRVEAHQRLAAPWLNLSFALIALAALLTGAFNRRGQSRRVMAAVVAMVATQALALAVISLSRGTLALVPLIYLAAVVPGLLALGFLARATLAGRPPAAPAAIIEDSA